MPTNWNACTRHHAGFMRHYTTRNTMQRYMWNAHEVQVWASPGRVRAYISCANHYDWETSWETAEEAWVWLHRRSLAGARLVWPGVYTGEIQFSNRDKFPGI